MNKDLSETGGASKSNIPKGHASQSSNLRSGSNAGSRVGNLKGSSQIALTDGNDEDQQYEIQLSEKYEDDDFKIYFDK